MVMLKALEAAINQIDTIQDYELTFTVDGQDIPLRPLRSHEETEVQRYSQAAWEGMNEEGDTAAYQDFMDRVRLSTLGFSIIRIGEMDLRDVEWIETGEFDPDGNPISVPKWEAIRDLIRGQWSKPLALQVFAKFGELLERIEITATRLVKFDPSDLEEEIERVEKRLVELKKKREEKRDEEPSTSSVEKAQKAVVKVDERHARVRSHMRDGPGGRREPAQQDAPPEAPTTSSETESPQAPQEPPQAPQEAQQPPQNRRPAPQEAPQSRGAPQEAPGRRSSIPEHAAPPERHELPDRSDEPQKAPEKPMVDEQGFGLPHDGDSFFDPSDPDAALAAESVRQSQLHAANLRRQREQKMARQRAEEMGMPSREDLARQQQRRQRDAGRPQATSLDRRTAGLREAANLHDHVFDAGGGREHAGRPQRAQPQPPPGRPQAPATLHGKPVYKMPTQTLEKPTRQRREEAAREHGDPAPSPVQINPPAGGRQDKFRGPDEQ